MKNMIIGQFFLWVNYQASISYLDSCGGRRFFLQPEQPTSRSYKRCLGEMAVFRFKRPMSNRAVIQKIKQAGFMPADIWCLISLLRKLDTLRISQDFLCKPACIVIPNCVVDDIQTGRRSPFVNVINGEVGIDFVQRSERDCPWYWLPYWKFLAVRWSGEVFTDVWPSNYRRESTIINGGSLTFSDD